MNRILIMRCRILLLFLSMVFSDQALAQYKLRFRIYENHNMCGCLREGVLVRIDPITNARVFHWTTVVNPDPYQYDFDLDYDPRNYRWNYEHIPASPSVCTPIWPNCGFTGAYNIPIYSGPDHCGTTTVDIPRGTNGRGIFVIVEFAGPVSPPKLSGGLSPDNICSEFVTIETNVKAPTETYTWEVSRSSSGPWKTLAVTTGNDVNKTVVSAALLNQRLADGLTGNSFHIRVGTNGMSCGSWAQRYSTSSLVVFQPQAPSVRTAYATSPTCVGGSDGSIVISELKNADGSLFSPTGELFSFNLSTSTSGNFYKIQSTTWPVTFNNTSAGNNAEIREGSWFIQVEGPGSFCTSTTNFTQLVTNPPAMTLQSAVVSQNIVCTGGIGAITVMITNGKAPFTYSITGDGNVLSNLRSNTFSNLLSGDYIVTVTDACGQSVSSGTIQLKPPMSVVTIQALTAQNVSCAGQTNGKLTAVVSGGTSPYAVQVDGGAFTNIVGSSYTASGLTAGNHQVTIRDSNGCLDLRDIVINTNAEVKGKILPGDLQAVTCAGGNNGLVVLTASGTTGVTFEYSLNGSAYQAINGFADLYAGTYAVSIRDKNGVACRWDSSVVITEPLPIHIDEFAIASSISCYEGSNGSLRASASGGNPQFGYTYHLLEMTSGANDSRASAGTVLFNNLSTGNYRLTVADGTVNCFVTQDLLLTEPAQVFLNPALSDYHGSQVSCTASSDGSITVRSKGGIYPHRISVSGRPDQWINSSTEAAVFDQFQAGDYFFTLSNNNGACQKDTLIRLLAPLPITMSISAREYGDAYNVSCKGSDNGIVSAQGSGGTKPYTYSMAPVGTPLIYSNVNLDSVSFVNLIAGNYSVHLTDINACSITDDIELLEPEELTVANIMKSDIFGYQLTCHGDQDAEVTVFSQGGSYPHTLALLVGGQQGISNSTADGAVFSDLGAGTYSFSIVDEEGCTASGSFDLQEPDAVALDNSQTVIEKPNCAGEQTGSLHLQAIGGIGTAYNYQLTYLDDRSRLPFPYPEQQSQTGNPVDFAPLIAGSYMITVTDQVGCLHSEPLLISTNHQVSAQLSTTDITCKSDSDGSATLSLAGGVAPYQVSWLYQQQMVQADQDILENQSTVIHDLKEGLYSFEVSDANGCAYYTGNYTFQVEGPEQALSLQATVNSISCQGNANGTVILQAQGGWQQTAYLYGTDLNQLNTGQTIYENLTPGVYRYFTKDTKGCVDTLDVTMTEPAVLASSVLSVEEVSCHGLSDGSFVLNVTGGTSPYQLSLDQGSSWIFGHAMHELMAATYEVSIKDSNACEISQTVVITQPAALQVLLAHQENTLCQQSSGSAEVSVTGGTSPYSFSWQNKNHQTIGEQSSINMLPAGLYIFRVIDDRSCAAELPVTIINTNDIIFDITHITGVTCYGAANGSAELSISAIQSPYSIQWDNGASGNAVFNLMAGERSVVVEDANQCQVTKTFSVPSPDALSLSAVQKTSPDCYGACNGQLSVIASGGTVPYQYNWQGQASTTNTISNACVGNYLFSLRDANNCLLEQTIELTGPALHELGMEDSTYYICQGQKVNISLPAWTQHSWSSSNGFTSQSPVVSLTQAGDYGVTATDAAGCMSHADFKVIYSTDLLKSEFLVPKETYVGDTIVCVNLSLPQPESWTWNFDKNKIVSLSQQGIYQQLVFLQEGEYVITLVSHLGGCVAEQSKKVIVRNDKSDDEEQINLGYEEKGIKTINVFPNPNDGHFKCEITLHEKEEIHVKLMNSYGQILAERMEQAASDFLIPFDMQVPSGDLYWLLITSETDRKVVKLLIK